jgi:hypothetical protein
LFPATFLKSFMMSRGVLVKFYSFFWYKIMLSVNKDSLTSSFLICITFISSSWLIMWLGIPGLCWIREGKVGTLVSFLILGEMVSVFHYLIWCWLYACHIGLSYIAFIILRYVASIPSFIRAFIMKWFWIYQRLFLHLLRWSSGFCLCFY